MDGGNGREGTPTPLVLGSNLELVVTSSDDSARRDVLSEQGVGRRSKEVVPSCALSASVPLKVVGDNARAAIVR